MPPYVSNHVAKVKHKVSTRHLIDSSAACEPITFSIYFETKVHQIRFLSGPRTPPPPVGTRAWARARAGPCGRSISEVTRNFPVQARAIQQFFRCFSDEVQYNRSPNPKRSLHFRWPVAEYVSYLGEAVRSCLPVSHVIIIA